MSSGTYVWQAPNLISHHRASWDACLHLSLSLADGDMHPCPGEAAQDPAGSLTIRWHQRAVAGSFPARPGPGLPPELHLLHKHREHISERFGYKEGLGKGSTQPRDDQDPAFLREALFRNK